MHLKINKPTLKKLTTGIRNQADSIKRITNNRSLEKTDVLVLIIPLLNEAFGYKKEWICTEERIEKKRVDIIIKQPQGFILCECKRFTEKGSLSDAAGKQLKEYCVQKGCEWGILTDGIRWQLWYWNSKIQQLELVKACDFMDLPQRITPNYCEKFYIFHSNVLNKERLEMKKRREALEENNIKKIIHSRPCLKVLQAEIKRIYKYKPSEDSLRDMLQQYFPLPQGVRPIHGRHTKKNKDNKIANIKNKEGETK